ncbi:hypothetical protein [Polyangium mundeleinium]|uniref:RelA/SpoT domain-containing protein n=1 Tax=Polyangium mundeleinium TaxID=2995306 RepID=A0ABT5ESX4_9BACT|nr:hypothetical protein [Polyangium mundeleinium]MDC0744303.1 hypothetical protein [Polyangium mundeleinium]
MRLTLTEDEFKANNRIDDATWKAADIEWSALLAIGNDAAARSGELSDNAAFYARALQRCPDVHSVRWRVKDPEHLMEKIVRKRAAKSEKYLNIDTTNYTQIVTDLIGLRALHLFKSQWSSIHEYVKDTWNQAEDPVAYTREGDSPEFVDTYKTQGCRVENHKQGYRSVHYIIKTMPLKEAITAEIQVRTIFEEGWSEIDHRVRYPNFSNSGLVLAYLATFNRLAGSADEMGEFVRALAAGVQMYENSLAAEKQHAQRHLARINELVQSLEAEKEKGAALDQKISELRTEVTALQSAEQALSSRKTQVVSSKNSDSGGEYSIFNQIMKDAAWTPNEGPITLMLKNVKKVRE